MKVSIKIVALTTVLGMATSLPDVYYPQKYPSQKQEQQWSRNQPSYVYGGRPYYPDWSTNTQNQQQGYSPDQNYLPKIYQEDDYIHSASPMYPKVKTIEIKSGPGPREFKLPLNGDPNRIEIHHLNAETYTTDEPSSPDSYSVIEGQNGMAAVRSMELIHHYSDSETHSKELDNEPEIKDVKIRLVSEDKLRHEEVNSNKVKVIRLNTTEYSEDNIPNSLPPTVRQVLKKALASLRKSQGIGQNNIDESRPEIEIAKSSSEVMQPVPRNNNASRPLYIPSKRYRTPIVFPTTYEPTQNNPTRNVPDKSFTQAPVTEISTSQDSNVAISEISSSSVKTQPTPTKRNSSGLRKNYYMVPIIPNRNSQTWRPKYRTHSKNIKKTIDENKNYDALILADKILSANESKETSKPTKVFRNEMKLPEDESDFKSEDSIKDAEKQAILLSVTDKSDYVPLTFKPLSTTYNNDSSSTIIPNKQKNSTSTSVSNENKPVQYDRRSNAQIPGNKTLPEDDSKSVSGDLTPTTTEANREDIKSEAILPVDTGKSISNNSNPNPDFTEASLTVEPLSTTDNYDSSSTIIPDNQKNSSTSPALDKNKPDVKSSNPKISDNKTLSDDDLGSVSKDLTPTPKEANKENIKSKAIFSIDTDKSVSNDSNPKLLAKENSNSSIPPNEVWTYTQPSNINKSKSEIPASSDVTLSDDAPNYESYTTTNGSSKLLSENIENKAYQPQNFTDSSSKIMSNQEISVTENNNNNTPKYYSNDLSNINTTESKSDQRVIYEKSIQEGNGTDNANQSYNTKEQNKTYILEDIKISSDDKVVGKSKSDAKEQDIDSLTKMNDASMDQENLSKVIQSEEDMNPLSFVVNLIINFCKGGDSVTKMFQDSKVQGFVSKQIPIINIQVP